MLDIRAIRENPEAVNAALQRRGGGLSVGELVALDARRLSLLQEEEKLREERNKLSKAVGDVKKSGGNADDLLAQSKQVADRIKALEAEKEQLAAEQTQKLLYFPNLPHPKTPDGGSEADNVVVKTWGDELKNRYPQSQPGKVSPHYDIGTTLGILDFERGVKLAHSRFTVLRGMGARLERALINFMLDTHRAHGYEEVLPPFLVNRETMTGTGQLPKFEEDMYRCKDDELFLIPTAEVPVTNLFRDEILDEASLPISFCAYTPCFRREAGAAGKDTRGLIRQHQFDKVELVKFVHPATSDEEHLKLLTDAERILQLLQLPYRVIELCTGDIGFAAARCFDIEVWMPGQGENGLYREISSCSVFTDFQARRANLKYRDSKTGKPALMHTINGSGLAVGRALAAILENYQIGNSEVAVPEVLRPYLGCETITPNPRGVSPQSSLA